VEFVTFSRGICHFCLKIRFSHNVFLTPEKKKRRKEEKKRNTQQNFLRTFFWHDARLDKDTHEGKRCIRIRACLKIAQKCRLEHGKDKKREEGRKRKTACPEACWTQKNRSPKRGEDGV